MLIMFCSIDSVYCNDFELIVADARDKYIHQFCVVWERGCTAFSTASVSQSFIYNDIVMSW